MSTQLYSFEIENIAQQRRQEFLREAEQYRMARALTAPSAQFLSRIVSHVNSQIATGVRALTRQPRQMQGAS